MGIFDTCLPVIFEQIGILAHAFPPSRMRSIAFSIFTAGAPIGAGLGVVLGSILTQESKLVERCNVSAFNVMT